MMGLWVRFPPLAPRRSKVRFAPAIFYKIAIRSLAPPLQTGPASLGSGSGADQKDESFWVIQSKTRKNFKIPAGFIIFPILLHWYVRTHCAVITIAENSIIWIGSAEIIWAGPIFVRWSAGRFHTLGSPTALFCLFRWAVGELYKKRLLYLYQFTKIELFWIIRWQME